MGVHAEQPTVIVVDDHDLFRNGLVGLLAERGIRILGQTGLGAEAIAMACSLHPDVVLMDLSMPGMSGVEATQRLTAAAALTRVLMLTALGDQDSVMDALLAGARGYLLKDSAIHHIIDGIRAVAGGESMVSPRVTTQLIRRAREPAASAPSAKAGRLTEREQEILGLVAKGLDNPEIAASLQLSQHTVKNHVSSILSKLEVDNRIQAAVRAVRGGMV